MLPATLRLSIPLLCLVIGGCAPDAGLKPLPHATTARSKDFQRSLGNLLGAPFVAGNDARSYQNGDEIFPAMLAGIRSAKRSITFETYVFEKGEVAQAFADALAQKARAGVKVLAIFDAQGTAKGRKHFPELERAGVQLVRYNRAWQPNFLRYNNRTHRKLLVIDGHTAFIGGAGIADSWRGRAQSPEHWRDNHYRVKGPVVAQIQAAFADNWLKARKEVLLGPDYFPELRPAGALPGSVFYASPGHGSFGVPVLYHTAIAAAAKSVRIQNAYFVPDDDTVAALVNAARRGARVQILVPGENIDQPKVRRAARKRYKRLIEAGAEIYEYQPTMLHSKLLIVDGYLVSVGSANFDNRSLHLNDEANMNILSAVFAAEQNRIFDRDLARSRRITLDEAGELQTAEGIMSAPQAPIEGQL